MFGLAAACLGERQATVALNGDAVAWTAPAAKSRHGALCCWECHHDGGKAQVAPLDRGQFYASCNVCHKAGDAGIALD